MNSEEALPSEPSEESPADTRQSRRVLMFKAGGLLIVWIIVGAALLVVLALLIMITVSLIGSL